MSSQAHRQPYNAAVYFTAYIAPVFCLLAIGKTPALVLVTLGLIFVANPIIDRVVEASRDRLRRLTHGQSKSWLYSTAVYAAVPVQGALLGHALVNGVSSWTMAVTAGLLCGISGGIIGLVAGHELVHRQTKNERHLGTVLLYITGYPRFTLEHILHHRWVGMPEDHDTARRNESLYMFLARSIVGGWIACWRWEAKQARRRGSPILSTRNRMVRSTTMLVLIFAAIYLLVGPLGCLVYGVQGFLSMVMLKWVNYVEHYGLERGFTDGRPEPVGVHHSWDSPTAFSNWALFNLGHHSHHHARPSLPYHSLPDSSTHTMPAGYAAMMVVALCPPLWRRVVNPRLSPAIGG